jgi:hypothetical protein
MKPRIFLGFCIGLLLVGSGCRNSNPVSPIIVKPPTLTVEEANCTEVWLNISVPSSNIATVFLQRDTTMLDTIRMMTVDTTIVDVNVLPSHTYTYTLAMSGVKSVTTQARTMDTTSHAFTWQSFTFGDGGGSCTLFDVAIINDTLAYAVGEIYTNGTMYNLARWNGQQWELKQLLNQGYPILVRSVFAINDTNIWFDPWFHWDGKSFQELPSDPIFFGIGIGKMWGNSDGLYVVGDGGFIAHRNTAGVWTQISSGTTLDVRDIWGAQNANTGSLEIYATAGDPLISPARTVLQISGTTTQAISLVGVSRALNGIWFSPGQYYWLVGDGFWEKHPTLSTSSWISQTLTQYSPEAVRGNAVNDVFICGDFGEMLHFNGVSWKSYISQTGIDGAYLGLSVSGNTVIAVGYLSSSQAIILMGKR